MPSWWRGGVNMPEPLGIYIHWPWCKAKCPYCDFNSHALRGESRETEYVEAVCRELRGWREKIGPERTVESVFFGGGTPSLMQAESIEKILSAAREVGAFLEGCEVTVECNPTSSSKTHFKGLAEAGVNRVSVGVQGLQEKWLKFLGRHHAVEEALATLEDAMECIGNVNADVIYGLPEQGLKEWQEQLEKLTGMGLRHISAYQLTIEKNTRFFSDVSRGVWEPVEGDIEADFFDLTREVLEGAGYGNYEISNFARPGFECVHNLRIWQGGDYIGVGAGAHGRVTLADGRRVATAVVKQPDGYLSRMAHGTEAFSIQEVVDGALAVQEAFLMGLRLRTGINADSLLKRHGQKVYEAAVDAVELAKMVDTGFLEHADGYFRLTEAGWPRLNLVLKRILRRHHL